MTITTSSNIEYDQNTEDFDYNKIDNGNTDTGGSYLSISLDTRKDLEIYDLKATELFPTSWCTTYSETITAITPGKALTTGNFWVFQYKDM